MIVQKPQDNKVCPLCQPWAKIGVELSNNNQLSNNNPKNLAF